MAAVVFDNRDGWKRDVIETSGLPFSRVRVLRRLARKAMSLREIAEATMMDAPAATVAINDLEDRGLVVRTPNPADRRCKLVSLTDAGSDVVARIERVEDPAPPAIASLSDADLRALHGVLAKLTAR
jgi:DNA-binding MarR family transcriptional regulator